MQAKKDLARAEAAYKLDCVNAEFASTQKRVADSMAKALRPFPGTAEDNITGTCHSVKFFSRNIA